MPANEEYKQILILLGKLESVPQDIKDIYDRTDDSNNKIGELKGKIDVLKIKMDNVQKCTEDSRQHYEDCHKERLEVEHELTTSIGNMKTNSAVMGQKVSFTEKYMNKIIGMGFLIVQAVIIYLVTRMVIGGGTGG